MSRLLTLGRLFFAISLAGFGIQYLLYGRFVGGLPPVPPWAPGGAVGAYLVGAFLLAAAVSIAVNWRLPMVATLIGSLFFLCVVLRHFLQFSPIIYSGAARTRALEPLSLAGAAFVLASALPLEPPRSSARSSTSGFLRKFGLILNQGGDEWRVQKMLQAEEAGQRVVRPPWFAGERSSVRRFFRICRPQRAGGTSATPLKKMQSRRGALWSARFDNARTPD